LESEADRKIWRIKRQDSYPSPISWSITFYVLDTVTIVSSCFKHGKESGETKVLAVSRIQAHGLRYEY
jgi:hypothetical protein